MKIIKSKWPSYWDMTTFFFGEKYPPIYDSHLSHCETLLISYVF